MEKNAEHVVVISGASGYVGSTVAKRLAADGMKVVLLYRKTPKGMADDILKELPGTGHRAYQCNLLDEDAITQLIAHIESDLGPLFACVHAAGVSPVRKALYLSTGEELRDQFESNALAGFNFLSACAKKLKEHGGGVLIGITTAGVVVPSAGRSLGAYIPAKYALQGILTSFREELSPFGVNVYSVAPGFMHGGMNSRIPQAFVDMIREKSATKKIASANDIAETISLLISHPERMHDLTTVIAPELE